MEKNIQIISKEGNPVGEFLVEDKWIELEKGEQAVHDVVVAYRAALRAGTASTKSRSDVKGGGAKPYRQKGTGNARRGDIKSPLLKGGGVVFGPTPRSYSYNLPKNAKKLGLKMALSSKFQENKLSVLDSFLLDEIKTKKFVEVIDRLNKKMY